jgi:transcriptional regulator GlxA family with amidase domain
MTSRHIRNRIPKDLYDDLYTRRKTVRQVAKELEVTENYLSHSIPERAPKPNPKLLKLTREMYRMQLARETLDGKHTVRKGAELACVSERTFYRRMKKARNAKPSREE